MLALLLVALLSMGIATGDAFGARQYHRSMAQSEAQILCSTLSSILREELSNARYMKNEGGTVRFNSLHYTPGDADPDDGLSCVVSVDEDAQAPREYGLAAMCAVDRSGAPIYMLLLPASAYSLEHALQVKLDLSWSGTEYGITISVRTPDGKELLSNSFTVIPLNTPVPPPESGT